MLSGCTLSLLVRVTAKLINLCAEEPTTQTLGAPFQLVGADKWCQGSDAMEGSAAS